MKKTFKKITAAIMAAATLAVGMTGMTASASTTDRTIDFSVPVLSWTNPTKPYDKDTSSSVYLYLKSGSNSVKVQTWGCTKNNTNYNWNKNLTLAKNGNSASYVTCAIGKEYQIYNSVKETGYGYAGLQMQTKGFSSNTVKGAWSPDFTKVSGHSYTIAN